MGNDKRGGVKPDSSLVIQAFMANEYNLSGNDLIVYAAIFGASQDGRSYYTGTKDDLAGWTGSTSETVGKILSRLEDDGLIERSKDGIRATRNMDAQSVNRAKKKAFVPPTLDEVKAYAKEKNLDGWVDATEFFDYYSSQGWRKANGVQITSWRQALSGWASRNKAKNKKVVKARDFGEWSF